MKKIIFFFILLIINHFSHSANIEYLSFKRFLEVERSGIFFKRFPIFISSDFKQYLFITGNKPDTNTIYRINVMGELINKIGKKGMGPGDLLHPGLMNVNGNNIYVHDIKGISIFSIKGEFIDSFRLFRLFVGFGGAGKNVFVAEIDKKDDKLITQYNINGKIINRFGQKQKINKKLFPHIPSLLVEGIANRGKVLIGSKHIFFVNYEFGDILKYDKTGIYIGTGNPMRYYGKIKFDKTKEYFFIKGEKRGRHIKGIQIIGDSLYINNKIFILSDISKQNFILEISAINLKVRRILYFRKHNMVRNIYKRYSLGYICSNEGKEFFYTYVRDKFNEFRIAEWEIK